MKTKLTPNYYTINECLKPKVVRAQQENNTKKKPQNTVNPASIWPTRLQTATRN